MTYILKSVTELALPQDFDCTEPELNRFLLNKALESESRGLCTTHLFCSAVDDQIDILGYFSLATTSINIKDLPAKLTERYPLYVRDSLTITLLARLALDKPFHRQGKGGLLLIEALKVAAASWKLVNSIGLVVQAKHDQAAQFYKSYGFISLANKDLELFMPRKRVISLVASA